MKRSLSLLFISLILVSCSSGPLELPSPPDLFEVIAERVGITDMYDLSDEMLEDVIGIPSESCESAVYMTPGTGISPEVIIIVKANTAEDVDLIEEKLEKRLAYVRKSAENYLIEEMPMIDKAVLRRDGLTVSLIISPKVSEINAVYDEYK